MTDGAAPMEEWADGTRLLIASPPEDVGRLAGLAGLGADAFVAVGSLDEAFPALCAERFAALLLALPLPGTALPGAVEDLRVVRQGPAIVVVGDAEDVDEMLARGASAVIPRSALTARRLRRALRAGWDSSQRVQRLVGHVLHLRGLVDSLLEGVVVISASGRVLYLNARATELLGSPEDELLFRPLPVEALQLADETGTPVGADRLAALVAARTGRPVPTVVHRLRRPDGQLRWVEVSVSSLRRRADGVPYAAAACFRDVTEERTAHAARLGTERRQRRLLEHAADGYLVLDDSLRVTEASPSVGRLLPGSTVVGADAGSLVHPDDRWRFRRALVAARADASPTQRLEARVGGEGPAGEPTDDRWVEATITGCLGDPTIAGVVVNLSDVTARMQAERERRFAEERLRLGFEHGTNGMTITDLEGRMLEVNPALCELLAEPADRLVGTMIAEWVHPEDRAERLALRKRLFAGEIDRYRAERRYVRSDGSFVCCLLNVSLIRDDDRRPLYLFSQFQDITDRKRNEAALEHRVHHDVLTDLPNRRGLEVCLEAALARAASAGTKVAVLFLDVDHFKVVNDGLGHAAGDVILVETARRLAAGVRDGDTVARFGGDEFIVVCEDVADLEEADVLARRTARLFEAPFDVDDKPISVTASCGIVLVDGTATAEEAIRDADTAMYEAKERGRGRPQVFDMRLRRAVSERLDVEQALSRAIEGDELRVAYQPVVSVSEDRTVGVEALVRWEHPERGTVSPIDFIPAAEESGLIVGIGELVLDAALGQVARWRAELAGCSSLWVAVNMSARQLSLGSPAGTCERLLRDHGLPADALRLELTESALMQDVDASVRLLEQVRELGVEVAIDDFGTGYSSLSYLSRLPVNLLKIDRSFIAGIGTDPHASEFVRTIASLAHVMGLETCAEGVERRNQLAVVARLGCELAQGYLWAPPLYPVQLASFVEERPTARAAAG